MSSTDLSQNLLTLHEAAQRLGVGVEVLLNWNQHHILKPTISETGEVAYTEQQINEFLTIQKSMEAVKNSDKRAYQNNSGKSLYQHLISWLGGEFYTDDFAGEYEKSKHQPHSLFPSFKSPSPRILGLAAAFLFYFL